MKRTKIKQHKLLDSQKGQAYLRYRRNLLEFEYLSKKIANTYKWLPRLQIEASKADPGEILRSMKERQKKVHKQVIEYRKLSSCKRKKEKELPPHIEKATNTAQLYLISPASTDVCQFVNQITDLPEWAWTDEMKKLRSSKSKVSFDWNNAFHQGTSGNIVQIGMRCNASLDDYDPWYWFNELEYCWSSRLFQLDVPANGCDSWVIWWMKYRAGIFEYTLNANDYGAIKITPHWTISPSGGPPSSNVDDWIVDDDHKILIIKEDGETDYESDFGSDPNSDSWFSTYRGSYEVKAGIASRIYFGFVIELWAADGSVDATEAYAFIGVPPTLSISNTPGVSNLNAGIRYTMWPSHWNYGYGD